MRAHAKPTTNMPEIVTKTRSPWVLNSADQVEVSEAAFVPICLKAHGSTPVRERRHSIRYCQNSSSCKCEITPCERVGLDDQR
jgi:hypothetical protein